jgi:hypothetical protein
MIAVASAESRMRNPCSLSTAAGRVKEEGQVFTVTVEVRHADRHIERSSCSIARSPCRISERHVDEIKMPGFALSAGWKT